MPAACMMPPLICWSIRAPSTSSTGTWIIASLRCNFGRILWSKDRRPTTKINGNGFALVMLFFAMSNHARGNQAIHNWYLVSVSDWILIYFQMHLHQHRSIDWPARSQPSTAYLFEAKSQLLDGRATSAGHSHWLAHIWPYPHGRCGLRWG